MVVVDANVLAYLLIEGPRSANAEAVRAKDAAWIFPTLCRHELLNIVTLCGKRGTLPPALCYSTWMRTSRLMELREHQADPVAAIRIALTHGVTGYDAQYIALAEQFALPCITEDAELLRKFPHIAQSMTQFLSASGASEVRESSAKYGGKRASRRSRQR